MGKWVVFIENESSWMGYEEPWASHSDDTFSDPSVNSTMTSVDYCPDAKSHLQIPLNIKK